MKIYLAGPMTGYADWNFPAFNEAAAALRTLGHWVFNPAELNGGDPSKPRAWYIRQDVQELLRCDAIAMLPGWQRSRMAKLEYQIAKELGHAVYEYRDGSLLEISPGVLELSVLAEADDLVNGDRDNDYGHPLENFGRIAAMWAAIFGIPITQEQVGLAMCCIKISRECNRHNRDNLVDLAGYANTVEMIVEERERRAKLNIQPAVTEPDDKLPPDVWIGAELCTRKMDDS